MAHGREGPDIVMTTRYVSNSEIRAVSEHEKNRTPDGSSAIDPLRSHLNEILHGPQTQQQAVDALYASGVKKPAAQAESPFVQIVLSASPEFFRADNQGPGEWDQSKLQEWRDSTMRWLREEYGDDLAHASLHLDEDTPHIHVLIVPTYTKKPRVPGRRKQGETQDEFEARKRAAQNGETIRTVGRSSNEYWKGNYVRRIARQSYHKAMEPLGLGYGRDFVGEGEASPERKATAQHVREQAQANKEDRAKIDADRVLLDAERASFREEKGKYREASRAEIEKIKAAWVRVEGAEQRNDVIRRDLDQLGDKIDKREELLTQVLQRVKRVIRAVADIVGLPLPKTLNDAVTRLEEGVEVYRESMSTPTDPFSKEGDDSPGFDPS